MRNFAVMLLALIGCATAAFMLQAQPEHARAYYLGFDRNDYPGDDNLAPLRQTFSYAGYWLGPPPGASRNSWTGTRTKLVAHHFGFLLLFNGRLYRDLRRAGNAALVGRKDAASATASAAKEGFRKGSVIFLDQEQGGTLLPEQFDYLKAWTEGVHAAGFTPGVYCSGIAVQQPGGTSITTAADLRAKLGGREVKLWVANDQCPPSPGCAIGPATPGPAASGTPDALVWQFAQSPRRTELTVSCAATYAADGRCYAPGLPRGEQSFVDLNSSTSPDPSDTR